MATPANWNQNEAPQVSPEAQPIQTSQGGPHHKRWRSTTYILIAINLLVFLAMVGYSIHITGVRRFLDTPMGARFGRYVLEWGQDYGPLTLSSQYWRVLTGQLAPAK